MSENDGYLQSPYNTEDTLVGIMKRLNECAEFAAAASELVTETRLVSITYGLVTETVQYTEYFRAWRMQDKKTLTAFQAHSIEFQSNH